MTNRNYDSNEELRGIMESLEGTLQGRFALYEQATRLTPDLSFRIIRGDVKYGDECGLIGGPSQQII
tara:strand:+ start:713 stop:913 length:201 start_codon:yes stop_codon:yes gene_type:complete